MWGGVVSGEWQAGILECRLSGRRPPRGGCLSSLVVTGERYSGGDRQGEQALEDGLDVGGPGPVGWEVQRSLSAASGEGGWGVEDLVLQGLGSARVSGP